MKKRLIFLFCCIFMAASLNAQEKIKETPSKEELIHAPTDKEISEYYTKSELFMLNLQYISPEQKQELLDKAKQQSTPKDTLSFRFEHCLPVNCIEKPNRLYTCFGLEKTINHGEVQQNRSQLQSNPQTRPTTHRKPLPTFAAPNKRHLLGYWLWNG